MKFKKISPVRVRYIKLGEGGCYEKECLEKNIILIGFGGGESTRYELCRSGKWNDVQKSFIVEGKTKGTATGNSNQLKFFFEDDGSTLWITFVGERLYWGMVDKGNQPEPWTAEEGSGFRNVGVRRTILGGWRYTDLNGERLTKDCLSGALTKLAAYRGTSCAVGVSDYVIRRINGEKTPEVERAIVASKEMNESALGLMCLLEPRDFELLVDLVFTTTGWRRVGIVGKTQKTLDLDLILPSTGERAFVQVKSKTTSKELAEYVDKIQDDYAKMFYVFHSGEAVTGDQRVTVIGPEKLAELVMDAGLVSWLIRKVS